jgi:effector-binding domain-containing protein
LGISLAAKEESDMTYVITTRDLAQQPVVSIRERRVQQAIPEFLGGAFDELFGTLGLLAAAPAGPPSVIYHEFGPDGIDAEVCVPVDRGVKATGRMGYRVLPSMTVAWTLHLGRYEDLGAAYAAVTDWIKGRGFEATGPVQERYLNGPGEHVSPEDYRTEVEIPVAPVAAAVPG